MRSIIRWRGCGWVSTLGRVSAVGSGLLAGYGVAVPVGAVGTCLLTLSSRHPLRTGASAALGVASADFVYALVAVLFGSAIAPAVRSVSTPLHIVAAAVLLALAARPLQALRTPVPVTPPRHAYAGFLLLTLANPATILYFSALTVSLHSSLLFASAAFAASASWQLTLACGGRLLGRFLAGRRAFMATTVVSSVLIALQALRILLN